MLPPPLRSAGPRQPTTAGPAAVSSRRLPPGLFALPFGILVLLAGLWGGLARLGYTVPSAGTSFAQHGFLMSLGFLGTLISTERAVALGRWWSWGVPAFSVLGSVWVVAGWTAWIGYAFFFAAGAILVAVYGRLDRIQRSTHNTLMGLAAVGWAVAAAVAMSGRSISDTVPWLAIFLVVTITAERLELSRMLKRSTPVRVSLVVAILGMVAGATVSLWLPQWGIRLTGLAMLAMAVWLGTYDLARRTIYAKGVTRFMAAGLLAGYVWLAGGGILWAIAGYQVGNPAYSGAPFNPFYDAELHTVFLGFVMSMVFAHAPVIAPAVIRKPLPYFPIFYAPLALLHAGLVLRVLVGDTAGLVWAWQIGGVLNEVAILAFVGVTVGAFARAAVVHRREIAARAVGSRSAPAAFAPAASPPPDPVTGLVLPSRRARIRSGVIGSAIGVAILVGAILFANSGTTASSAGGTTAPPAGSADVITAAEAAAGVDISLVDLKILPAHLVVERGAKLVLNVKNNGAMQHDLHLATGPTTPMLDPGQSAVLDAGVIDAPVEGWCTVPGHRQAGMVISITVAVPGAATPPNAGTGGMAGMAGMGGAAGGAGAGAGTASSSNDAVSPDLTATPPAGWKPVDASLPPAPNTTVHDVTWHIKNVETAVAPGVTQLLWTFDGRVPGPVLRGKVGDRFNVTVVNDTDMTHNIDFHAESGPPAKVMTPIPAGKTHTYSFVATHAGAWLYHCSVEPMLMHMGNGMYGAIIIDPPDLAPAGAEYVLVGSELFFGPQGQIGDYAKMLADKPDAVAFNGYPFAYQHAPLTAKVGELVRIWVVDAGPTRSLAFHVIGAQFTTEYLNGAYLLKDGTSAGVESGAAQTLPVDPGNGGFVELRFSEPGTYPFLTHAMADAVIGATGAFTVTN
ncbi:MAG: multicopper oxidase domain-containing protein [Actinobacteria bacterium]|nr:multicopper oxidase domain-containing protein [Actinomycetota bacterium]